ncbi:MAG: hypothetical protein PVI23_09855 [Maricaulaceae bacterium]|jgi:hypothetical protein
MIRLAIGVVAGFVAFGVIIVLTTFIVGAAWPELANVEDPLDYTNPMRFFRLGIGAAATLVGGAAAGLVSRRGRLAGLVLGVVFVIGFVPVHISLWTSFPVWYHATFLIYLIPLSLAGAAMFPGAPPRTGAAASQ